MKARFSLVMCILAVLSLSACTITVNLGGEATSPASIMTPLPPEQQLTLLPPEGTPEIQLPTGTPMTAVTLYFMNQDRFAMGTEPYEDAVTRLVPAESDLPRAVLDLYFAGPTDQEMASGMRLYTSGFTHVRNFTIQDGIARVYLGEQCANNGAAYSVAALIMKNLSQFPQITAVKIYDENDETEDPDSANNSIPYCLEP